MHDFFFKINNPDGCAIQLHGFTLRVKELSHAWHEKQAASDLWCIPEAVTLNDIPRHLNSVSHSVNDSGRRSSFKICRTQHFLVLELLEVTGLFQLGKLILVYFSFISRIEMLIFCLYEGRELLWVISFHLHFRVTSLSLWMYHHETISFLRVCKSLVGPSGCRISWA